MTITYKTKKLEKVCTVYSYAVKQYGSNQAFQIHKRVQEITASDSVETRFVWKEG